MNAVVEHELSPLETLILAWLLSQREGGTPSEIKKAVQAIVAQRWTDAEREQKVDEAIAELDEAKLIERRAKVKRLLTEKGRSAARGALGLKPRSAKLGGWKQVKTRCLFALALGASPPEVTPLPAVRNAAILARHHRLGAISMKETLEKLAGKAVGATRAGVGEIENVLLTRWIQGVEPVPAASVERVPAVLPVPVHPPAPAKPRLALPEDDQAFAARVLAAARASKTGRFGENKVFISHVLGQLAAEGFAVEDTDTIKARLVDAHRKDLLSLSRADLVEVMAPEDVNASETQYRRATFHFVRI